MEAEYAHKDHGTQRRSDILGVVNQVRDHAQPHEVLDQNPYENAGTPALGGQQLNAVQPGSQRNSQIEMQARRSEGGNSGTAAANNGGFTYGNTESAQYPLLQDQHNNSGNNMNRYV
jgi:hypothetical protein